MLSKDVFEKATIKKVNMYEQIKMKHWWNRYKITNSTDENPLPLDFENLRKKSANKDFQKES